MKEEIRDMEDKVRSSIIYLVGVPEEDNGKNCKEAVFEKIIAEGLLEFW